MKINNSIENKECTSVNNTIEASPLFGGNYGWVCPKCGRVYSPFTHMCPYCVPDSMNNITYTSTTINKI